jgi:hypothetical protein
MIMTERLPEQESDSAGVRTSRSVLKPERERPVTDIKRSHQSDSLLHCQAQGSGALVGLKESSRGS